MISPQSFCAVFDRLVVFLSIPKIERIERVASRVLFKGVRILMDRVAYGTSAILINMLIV